MLPPHLMLTIKNRAHPENGVHPRRVGRMGAAQILTLVITCLWVAGCAPPGPRALLNGERLIERGKYPEAVEQLQVATSLLPTNAQAWNYLGLAWQYAGQPAEAEKAYRNALRLDRDLTEAHFNLGCLHAGQNNLEAARSDFTTYTLRRPNAAEGWVKLGSIQAQLRDLVSAERSFKEALRFNPQNVEAMNELGLIRLQSGRPDEAAAWFDSALKRQNNYRPALLNMAIVAHQYLRNRELALQKYRAYLALKPAPENADAVRAIVRQIEQELAPPRPIASIETPPSTSSLAQIPTPPPAQVPTQAQTKPPPVPIARVAPVPKPEAPDVAAPKPVATTVTPLRPSSPTVSPPAPPPSRPPAPATPPPVEVVRLPPEPVLKPATDMASPAAPLVVTSEVANASAEMPTEPAGLETRESKRGILRTINPTKLFRSERREPSRVAPIQQATTAKPAPPATPTPAPPRYPYRSPARPAAGDRGAAERYFAQGATAHQNRQLAEAIAAYRQAIKLDPAYFEAYYNLAVAVAQSGDMPTALASYETALVIRPDSLDTLYNFGLALKRAGYSQDAANELEKAAAIAPTDLRYQLTLGHLYAHHLNQTAKARQHYEKVLELDPQNPEATQIRYWMADHP